MKEGAKVTAGVADKCSSQEAVAGTEEGKRDQRKKAKKHFQVWRISSFGSGILCLCVCTCTREELLRDVNVVKMGFM